MDNAFVIQCIRSYGELIAVGLPIAFCIGAANLCINMLIDAFFHGKLHIGGRS